MRITTGLAYVALVALWASPSWSQGSSKGSLRYGLEAPRSVSNVILLNALDRMKTAGYAVEIVDFNSPETMTLALQNGAVDFVSTSAGTAFSAIDAGFRAKAFMGSAKADFQMVARKELTSCESLDGKRVAVQSREGTTGVLARNWFATACPTARPSVMVIPGSENRVAGLIAGQLDAAPVDLQNTAQLLQLRPDNFGIIQSFGESVQLVGSVYYASTDWLTKNEKTVKDFVATYVDTLKEAQRDSTKFKETLYRILPEAPRPLLDKVLAGWLEQEVYIPVKGVQPEMMDFAIQFYGKVRPYRTIKSAADVATTDYLPAGD